MWQSWCSGWQYIEHEGDIYYHKFDGKQHVFSKNGFDRVHPAQDPVFDIIRCATHPVHLG